MADIDCVAFYEDLCQKLSRQLWVGMLPGLGPDRRASIRNRAIGTYPEEELRLVTGHDGPIEIVDHHLSHAASAYFFSL
jgi:carbamoyltransferase